MTGDLEALRERIASRPKRGRKKVWEEPQVSDFAPGAVLSFDQTLTKTGVSLVVCDGRRISVLHTALLRPAIEDLKGFEQTFAKAEVMGNMLAGEVLDWARGRGVTVVHEMPAVQGHRIESSLMAAREIRRVCGEQVPVSMISRTAAYATLTGQWIGEKRLMTEAVNRLIERPVNRHGPWNQDVHDAVGLALKHLYDKQQALRSMA